MIILDSAASDCLRCKYIETFVNTKSLYYVENIKQKTFFNDGLCYVGYLWDCLKKTNIISESEAEIFLQKKGKVFIMWDIHSSEMILIPNYWKYPKTQILCADQWSNEFKPNLPEDLYIFDDTFSWSIIYTHETDEKGNPYCLCIKKAK